MALSEKQLEFQKIARLEEELMEVCMIAPGDSMFIYVSSNAWAMKGEPGSLTWEEIDARIIEYLNMNENEKNEIIKSVDEFHRPDFILFMQDQTKAMKEWVAKVYPDLEEKEAHDKWEIERAKDYREEWKKANPGKDIESGN